MKKGPFKLKSGNKPSMAQLSGVSPVKDYKKSLKYKLLGKAGRAKMDAKYASGESTKTQKDVKNVFSRVDKAIQGFFNNPRSKAAGGDSKTYLPPKKGIASGSSSATPTATPPKQSKSKVTYKQAWNKMSNKAKSEYGFGEAGFKKFKKAAIDYNKNKKK